MGGKNVEKGGKKMGGNVKLLFYYKSQPPSENSWGWLVKLDVDGVDGDVRRLGDIIIAKPIGPWPKRMNRAVVDGAEMNLCGIIKKEWKEKRTDSHGKKSVKKEEIN